MLSLKIAAATAVSIYAYFAAVDAQVTLQQATYNGCYSSSAPLYTNETLTYQFQTSGWCAQQCGNYAEKAAFALSKGSDCYCGDKFPPESAKVDDSECNRPCQGYGSEMCGGTTTFSVYNSGLTTNVENASEDEAAAAAETTSKGSSKATKTASQVQSTVTQAGQTVVVTTSATPSAGDSDSSSSGSGGANKAAIAAGVVVGILAIAGIVGGALFYMRHKKRREIEQDHQRQQAVNNFARAGTVKSEHSSADTRLDPTMMYRRQSDGSISDERDLSRRVLKVTNPDRNTMIA